MPLRPWPWLLLILCWAGGLVAQTTPTPVAASASTLRVIEIGGTPWERGFSHGQQLQAEIGASFAQWRQDTQQDLGVPLDEFVARFLAATSYDQAVRRWTPELLDEVRGIAAGAGQPFELMFAWQLIDEVWANGRAVLREKCTSVGVDRIGDQPALVAQNLDLPVSSHGYPTVLRVRDEARGLQTLVVTLPGLIAAAGMSSARVAVAVNTLLQLRPCRDGLPVAFVVRGLLLQPDQPSALAFLRRIKHASGQNYTVGGPETAPGFECSAGKVVRWQPVADAPFTFHTNNPLVNDDFAPAYREQLQKGDFDPFVGARPCARLAVCRQTMTATSRPDAAMVQALLSSRQGQPSICNASTFACYLMLPGEEPEMRIAPGRPDRTPFEVLRFQR